MSRHPDSLTSPIYTLSDGRKVIEINYALASHFNHAPTLAKMNDKNREACKRYAARAAAARIPDRARDEAAALARGLTDDLRSFRQSWKSRQRRGRLDGRALVRVVDDVRLGKFSEHTTRPFKAKQEQQSNQPPRVAIVADYNFELRDRDSTYEKRVGALACAVLWACEAADLPCTFAAIRGDWFATLQGCTKTSSIAVISRPGAPIDAATYEVVTAAQGQGAFIDAHSFATTLPNDWNPEGSSSVPGSSNGCGGVRWAREIEGCTFVIAIGEFADEGREADVLLPARTSAADAVKAIREALAIRQAAAA